MMADLGASKQLRRLQNEFKRAQDQAASLRFHVNLVNGDYFHWAVSVENTFRESAIGQDLSLYGKLYGQESLDLEIRFSADHPLSPPSIRVVSPRFKVSSNSPLALGGAISTPSLSEQGWTPVVTVDSLISEVKAQIQNGGLRIETAAPGQYSLEEEQCAKAGFYRAMKITSLFESEELIAVDEASLGGKVLLPASSLEQIMMLPNAEFPLIFEVANSTKTRSTYVGVSDFSSAEGTVLAPTWILSNVQSGSTNTVTVRLAQLPKGSFLKIKPVQAEFFKLDAQKEILESVLRSFVAVTTGDNLQVTLDGQVWNFDILETRPARAVNINNTDVEVEIVGSLEDVAHATAEKVTAADVPQPGPSTVSGTTADHQDNVVVKQCQNCLRKVPEQAFESHSAFCLRHNQLCKKCSQVVRIADLAAHEREYHMEVPCGCGQLVEKYKLVEHKHASCPHRLVVCQFCKLSKRVCDLNEHEAVCGTRTDKCSKCGQFVKLKDAELHASSNCKLPVSTGPARPPEEPSVLAKILV